MPQIRDDTHIWPLMAQALVSHPDSLWRRGYCAALPVYAGTLGKHLRRRVREDSIRTPIWRGELDNHRIRGVAPHVNPCRPQSATIDTESVGRVLIAAIDELAAWRHSQHD